jgi:hypothetical protein
MAISPASVFCGFSLSFLSAEQRGWHWALTTFAVEAWRKNKRGNGVS